MGYIKTGEPNENQANLYSRVKKLLDTFEWSDCSFSVGEKIFKAHKLILGISSPVFEAMFYGPLSTEKDIMITDIEPDVFQLILNYIYTDNVEITSTDQAFDLLYASKKYFLDHLTETCIGYIQANVSVDNVIEVLNYPDYMHDNKLTSHALKLFGEHANYLFQEKKNLITNQSMRAILECNKMNILEKDLIKHVFEWSACFCEQKSVPVTIEKRREMLNKHGLFKLLRFKALSVDDLQDIFTDQNNLLSPSEFEDINKKLIIRDKIKKSLFLPIDSIVLPRHSLQLQWYACYRSPIRPVAPIVIDTNNYIVECRVKVNKSVFINSLCVPTRMEPAVYPSLRNCNTKVYTERLSIVVLKESDKRIINKTNLIQTLDYDSVADLDLKEVCFLKKNEWYNISFIWPNNRFGTYSYVVELRNNFLSYNCHNVTFEFDDLPLNSGKQGSFIAGLKFCL